MGPDDLPPWAYDNDGPSELERLRIEALDLKEFRLKEINGRPINENKNAAWEIIEGAYCIVLEKDLKWHYFYEDTYNIIRCSFEFAVALAEYLEDCGIEYSHGHWIDGQPTTYKYQHIFCPMFHTFSMMAINGYGRDYSELYTLFDRVAHCFLNHQYLRIHEFMPGGTNWEAQLVAHYAVNRAFYSANHATNMLHKEINKKKEKEKWWAEKCLEKTRKWLKRKKNPA